MLRRFISRIAAFSLSVLSQERRRARILRSPFPTAWLEHLKQNVRIDRFLSRDEQTKLRNDLRIFLAEKDWEGCAGLTITDEIKVAISAQACVLLLGMEHDYFSHVRSILVYPSVYRVREERIGPAGVISQGHSQRVGEAWYRGPVVLAWDEVLADGRHHTDGRNVVFHEFAHQLDFLDGLIDGTPPLEHRDQYRRWYEVMTDEYEALLQKTNKGKAVLLDEYGTTNSAEFFSVATECFFEQPAKMRHRHPRLYQVLRDYYRQDPAKRREKKMS